MGSTQTLSEDDRRLVAGWAADCAERVLGVFEAAVPGDDRPRESIARTRAYARGELDTAAEIRRRFEGGGAAREAPTPAAKAAAKAAGQAAAVAHMGAHALGAAAYAARAAGLRAPAAAADCPAGQAAPAAPATAAGRPAGPAVARPEAPDLPDVAVAEVRWQLAHASAAVRAALRQLPRVGTDGAGPLGPGLLATGQLGALIRALQAGLG